MGIKQILRAVTPSPVLEYIWRKRIMHRELSVIKEYMRSTGIAGFTLLFLNNDKDYGKTGNVFNGEQYYSQAYQDYFLDSYIFRKKKGGFFLDIGGNDPIHINNTYFFEKSRDWSGLAFEPITVQREKWKTSRTTECLPYALGKMTGEAAFCEYEDHTMSGFSDEVKFGGKVKSRYKVPVRRLADILDERGIRHIDFVSLDVEGAEMDVLQGIDFSRVEIDCFTIEKPRNAHKEERLRKFMVDAGYRIKARLWIDEVWIRKGFER